MPVRRRHRCSSIYIDVLWLWWPARGLHDRPDSIVSAAPVAPCSARRLLRTAVSVGALAIGARLASAQSAPVLKAMSDELTRNFVALKTQPTPPYFLSYEVTDTRSATVSSEFG